MIHELELAVLALVLLHEVGKAGSQALRGAAWAREPLCRGLPISDLYHALSGVQWLLVLWACWAVWGLNPWWWLAAFVCWGLIWPASKRLRPVGNGTIGLRAAFLETWYVQILRFLFRR